MSNLVLNLLLVPSFISGAILLLVELIGPALAERKDGGTPWHAHHIAEWHSLFVLIPTGEGRRMADPDFWPSSGLSGRTPSGLADDSLSVAAYVGRRSALPDKPKQSKLVVRGSLIRRMSVEWRNLRSARERKNRGDHGEPQIQGNFD